MQHRTWAALWIALASLGAAQAQPIYKWVDAQGATQYTSTPPPAGVPSTLLRAATGPSAQAASQAQAEARRSIEQAERLAAERRRDEASRQAQTDAAQRDAAQRQQRCASARAQLDVVQGGGPVLRYDARGQRIYLDDSQRDAEIARLQGEAARWCGADGSSPLPAQGLRPVDPRLACAAARERLRELQDPALRSVPSDLAAARQRVQQACGGP